jgi:hypothetical protein
MRRSQVSFYIVMGIVFLGIISVIIWSSSIENGSELVKATQKNSLSQMVRSCAQSISEEAIEMLALQGGTFSPKKIVLSQKINYTYWCENMDGRGCVSFGISRASMENELSKKIEEMLEVCVDMSPWENAGYKIIRAVPKIKSVIGKDTITFDIHYPVRLEKSGITEDVKKFSLITESELGNVFDVAANIIAEQEKNGWFDEDNLMRESSKHLMIRKHQPYPDVVVGIEKYNERTFDVLTFYLAWNGGDYATEAGKGKNIPNGYGSCQIRSTCLANVPLNICEKQGGTHITSEMCEPVIVLPRKHPGNNCGFYKDGESWCLTDEDDTLGFGFDTVGSGYYKQSCYNGRILTTECADYRNEICTQTSKPFNAVCRPNRWQDCVIQKTEETCEDSTSRDCFWAGYLAPEESPEVGKEFKDNLCHPNVPPGFKFWEFGAAQSVCEMANELRHCNSKECPQTWTDANAIYCHAQGDCGNYYNVDGTFTSYGFFSTDKPESPIIYNYSMNIQGKALSLHLHEKPAQSVSADIYYNERANTDAVLKDLMEFAREAATWDECTFCDCIGGIPVGNCEFNKYIHADTRCSLWEPPKNADNCEACGLPGKPCTEYWCKSLGSCKFIIDSNGFGQCDSNIASGGDIKIEIDIPDKTLTPSILDIYNGWEIKEPYEPYTNINVMLTTNMPASCEVSSLPWIFDDSELHAQIPLMAMFFKGFSLGYTQSLHRLDNTYTRYELDKTITPWGHIFSHIKKDLDLNSLLDFGVVQKYNLYFVSIKNNFDKFASKFSKHIDLSRATKEMDKFFDKWLWYKPKVEFAMAKLGNVARQILIDNEQGKSYAFFRCKDGIGNVANSYVLYEKSEDVRPPTLLNVSVENSTFKIQLNEPATCKFGELPSSYENMPYSMNCTLFSFDTSIHPIECIGEIPESAQSKIHLACRDIPPYLFHYYLVSRFNNTYQTTQDLSNETIEFVNDTFIVHDMRALRSNTTHLLMPSTTPIILTFDDNTTCGINDEKHDDITKYKMINCGMNLKLDKWACTLALELNKNFAIGCHEITPSVRNEMTETVVLQ